MQNNGQLLNIYQAIQTISSMVGNLKQIIKMKHFKPKAMLLLFLVLCIVGFQEGGCSSIAFLQSSFFGSCTMNIISDQVKLQSSTGLLSQYSTKRFSIANEGYSNLTSLGLALCGYDIPTTSVLQYTADIGYDSTANQFTITLLIQNSTQFGFLNYFIIIVTQQANSFLDLQNICFTPSVPGYSSMNLNRPETYQFLVPFWKNNTNQITVFPFFKSILSIVATTYNMFNITNVYPPANGTNRAAIRIYSNYSYMAQVCLSILTYFDTVGMQNSFMNISYSSGVLDSTMIANTISVVASTNFSISNIYGPSFNKKCIVGLSNYQLSPTFRQTLTFDLSSAGVTSITSTNSYLLTYNYFCVVKLSCQLSSQQYYPFVNDCQDICTILNCTTCSTSTSCSVCQLGFYINALYRCSPCKTNCINCTTNNNCFTCSNGTFYSGTSCVSCALNCLSCTPSSCSVCSNGYFAQSTQCILCSSLMVNCVSCTLSYACSQCSTGYFFEGTQRQCLSCSSRMPFCINCTSSTCTQCDSTSYLASANLCSKCDYTVSICCGRLIPNCNSCKNNTSCQNCNSGYFVNSTTACSLCSTVINNCQYCTNNTCTLCFDGFYLQNNTCILCNTTIQYCSLCLSPLTCNSCISPYKFLNGSCLNCITWPLNNMYIVDSSNTCQPCSINLPNCKSCTSISQCQICLELFFLSNNSCSVCSEVLPNCLRCDNKLTCINCYPGFYLVPPVSMTIIQCFPCSNLLLNCLQCKNITNTIGNISSNSVICSTCQPQYYINSTTITCNPCNLALNYCLKCILPTQCVQCSHNFYLNNFLQCVSCQQFILGCTICNETSCLLCAPSYKSDNNYCSLCSISIQNCHTCSLNPNNTLICNSCEAMYYLTIYQNCSICYDVIPFCYACSTNTLCTQCITGYYLNQFYQCTPCLNKITNCTICDITSIKCLKCDINFQLSSDSSQCIACSALIANCIGCSYVYSNTTNTSMLSCSQCQLNYLSNMINNIYLCVSCSYSMLNCESCSSLTNCTSCFNISFLSATRTCTLCSLYLSNCYTCSDINTCTSCLPNYYLSLNSTCTFCDLTLLSNCIVCQSVNGASLCQVCQSGYYLETTTFKCISCSIISSCSTCINNLTCLQCRSGNYLSTDNSYCHPCGNNLTNCYSCNPLSQCIQCQYDSFMLKDINIIGLNYCYKCDSVVQYCLQCITKNSTLNNSITCNSCKDSFYLQTYSGTCKSCSASMPNCILCKNSTTCQYVNSQNVASTTISDGWVIAGIVLVSIFGLILLILLGYCIYRIKNKNNKDQHQPTLTEREIMKETEENFNFQNNQVEINKNTKCQMCHSQQFQVMNLALLCKSCEDNVAVKKRKQRILRKDLKKQSTQPQTSQNKEEQNI